MKGETMSVRELDLTPAEFALTSDKIAKLNARAVKRGWTGILTVTGEAFTEVTDNGIGLKRERQMVHTVISGNPPKYDGWTFLARADWADGGMVLFTAPGVEGIDRTGITEGACDHCKINRYRKSTYIVRSDAGEQLQVGSTCLKDFLGWNTNPVWIVEPSDSDLFGDIGYGHSAPVYSVDTVLAAAWACVEAFGYVRSGEPNSTKYTVLSVLDPRTPDERKLAEKLRPHVAESYNAATMIREFILSDAFSGYGDYVLNLKNIARSEFVEPRFFGFLVSAPQAWAKAQERTLIKQREKSEVTNEFLGSVGDKLDLPVTLKAIRFIDGDWGVTTLYTFVTDDGHIVKWFSTRTVFTDADVDKSFDIRGTVKKHDEYNGTKSTVLTRCKKL
jgi:hypothetical protein